MWRDLRHASQFATQRATAGNGPARSNPGAEGPHPQPADSQKNPRGTAAATRARGPVSHPAGRRYADPPTGRKGQDDGHEWAEDRAAHSLSVVLFTSRTMVAGLSGMASGCAMTAPPFVSLHREGRGIYRGGGQCEKVGSVDDTVRALLLPAPARRALRAGVAGRRFQPFGHLVADVAVPAHGPIARGGRLMAAHPRFASPSSEGAEDLQPRIAACRAPREPGSP